eukprot:13697287-Alexandrium_andersonii.AAC.1
MPTSRVCGARPAWQCSQTGESSTTCIAPDLTRGRGGCRLPHPSGRRQRSRAWPGSAAILCGGGADCDATASRR